MSFARINAVTLHYEVHGSPDEQPVLVLINALGTDLRIWDDLISRLEDRFAVIVYDKRGHGLSDLGQTPYTIEDHAADLAGLLEHVGVTSATICGLSIGGLIALALCSARPDLIQALVLSNTAHKIGTANMWAARIAKVREEGLLPQVNGTMEKWFTGEFRTADNPVFAGVCNMLARQPSEGYVASCAAIRDADYTGIVSTMSVPCLCLSADQDGSTSPEVVKAMADMIPDAEYCLIRNAGHLACMERPDQYADAILAFAEKQTYE